MAKIETKSKKIENLLTRGVENIYPSPEWLKKKIKSGKKIKIYLGIDPTAPTLHIGHAIALKKLAEFQTLGHEVVLLIGSFTGMIGDPTDKAAVRKPLTRKQVLTNAKKYKQQAEIFIKFKGPNPAKIVYNHKWLDKLTLKDLAEIGMLVTTQRLLERDMFQERIKKESPVYFTELIYPLLQGFDSVAMEVDGEIGGNDQTFNMLMGRDLLKKMKGKEKFVLTMKLLTDPTGKKMGKSEGNMITLEDSPEEMVGKIMSWPDQFIEPGFELCTDKTEEEIKENLKKNNPRNTKMELAKAVAEIYHGIKKTEAAAESWEKAFSRQEAPNRIEEVKINKNKNLLEAVAEIQDISKSQAKRLLEQGGIKIDGNKEEKGERKLKEGEILKIGKKRFVKIRI